MKAVFTVKYITNFEFIPWHGAKIPEENDILPLCHNYTIHFCLSIHIDDWVS